MFTGYCSCCDLSLDPSALGKVPELQFWIWAIFMMITYMVWLLFLERCQTRSAETINRNVITAGDYAVLVSGTGVESSDNDELRQFACHYGEVVSASHLTTIGKPLAICVKVGQAPMIYAKQHIQ